VFNAALFAIGIADAQLTQAQKLVDEGYKFQIGEGVERNEELALKHYKEALKLNENQIDARFNAALIYYGQGKYKLAGHQYNKIAKWAGTKQPEVGAKARNMLGSCLQMTENLKEAENQFRLAIKLAPSQFKSHFNLINLMVIQNRIEEAKEVLKTAKTYAHSERYEAIESKIRGIESREDWEPKGTKIAILALAVVLFLYWAYKRFTA
tara:strand:- start:380 stop:1006 length:627 start_codon:yes stop_codon:yes gene_type:complete